MGGDLLVHPLGFPTQTVERLVAGDRRDPRARAIRDTVDRPAFQRDHEGVLHRLLGRVEAAEEAGEGGEGVARLGAERGLEGEVAQPAALKSTHG